MVVNILKGKSFCLKKIKELSIERFNFNKEYQRSKVWDKKRKQKLIDSIIKILSIGTLILKKNGEKFEVLDGQQRLRTIFDFIEREFKTSPEFTPEFPDKSYEDIEQDATKSAGFDSFRVYYDLVDGGTDQEIANIFLRLQEGLPLNVPEKLNAMLGKMRDFIVEISKTPLFERGIKVGKYRFAHRGLATQITLLELETKFDHEPYPEFPDLRFGSLKKMYKDYETSIPRRVRNSVIGNINFLQTSLGKDARIICRKSDLPLIYILVSYLRKKYVIKDINLFKDFLIDFLIKVEQRRIGDNNVREDSFGRYKELRSKGLTTERFTERFTILLGEFLSKAQEIQLKDKQKLFDLGQKLAIYYNKNRKICQYCNKEVEWENASFHHKKFRCNGGLTTVKNSQLMHKKCHDKFHREKGKDDD